jgi:CheY-like chemotaxis protein
VNGREALELFTKSVPWYYDAILMDVKMPEMDGLEATEAIRALDRSDAELIPIVAMTANAFDEDIKRSLQAGMNAHLTKPFDAGQLCAVLGELIARADAEH